MVQFIDNDEVKEKLDMNKLIKTIREAFISYYKGNSKMPEKSYIEVPKGDFRSMPAMVSLDNYKKAGVKWVNVHPQNKEFPTVMGGIILCDPETGEQEYFIEAEELTAMRTGAVSGVSSDVLAPEDVNSLGIVGAGKQSYKQLEAIRCVRDIDEVVINDLDERLAENFVRNTSDSRIGTKSEACSCDILCTVTPSTEPIVKKEDLGEIKPYHINAIGADAAEKQEFEIDIIEDSQVVVDDLEQASHSGEISKYMSSRKIPEESLYTLGEVIFEKDKVEKRKRTLYDSTGIAIQDISSCKHLIE